MYVYVCLFRAGFGAKKMDPSLLIFEANFWKKQRYWTKLTIKNNDMNRHFWQKNNDMSLNFFSLYRYKKMSVRVVNFPQSIRRDH